MGPDNRKITEQSLPVTRAGESEAGSVAHLTAVRRGTHFLRGVMKGLSLSEAQESFITETGNIMQNRLKCKNLTS